MNRVHYWHTEDNYIQAKKDYYIETIEEYNSLYESIKNDDTVWLNKMLDIVKHYTDVEINGGSLHIILEDGNLEDSHLYWCAGLCYGYQDHEGSDIANLMIAMTMKQRELLYNLIKE